MRSQATFNLLELELRQYHAITNQIDDDPCKLTARQILYYLTIFASAERVLSRYEARCPTKAQIVKAYYLNATGADLSRKERMQFIDLVAYGMGWPH